MLKLKFKNNVHPDIAVDDKRLTIGRDKSNLVILDLPGISGFHAEIHNDEEKLLLVDMGSANGTFLNDSRIQGRREIKLWDNVRLDTVEFEIVDSEKRRPTEVHVAITEADVDSARINRPSPAASGLSKTTVMQTIRPKLVGESGAFSGRSFDLKLPATIGRDTQNTVVIESDTVSTRHARITDDGNGWRIDDLGSTNGTYVNSNKISSVSINHGDRVRFGMVEFRFDSGTSLPARTVVMPQVTAAMESTPTKTSVQPVPESRSVPAWAYGLGSFLVVGVVAYAILYPEKINITTLGSPAQPVTPLQAGQTWAQKLPNGRNSPATPVMVDINGDKVLDLVVGDAHGFLTAFDGETGKQIFELDISDRILASLASADLTGDGQADIIAATNSGLVVAVNGKGQVLWRAGADLDLGQIVNRPVLFDINGDKVPDVIIPTMAKGLVALDGSRGWKIWDTSAMATGKMVTSPLMADLNGDGVMDYVVVTDVGEVLAVTTQGKNVLQLWKSDVPKVTYASATYAKSGKGGSIIVATESGVVALAANTGRIVWQTRKPASYFASPVATDLNGDGVSDAITVAMDGNVVALDGNTGDELWASALGVAVKASPALYDFNGDKVADIVLLDETGGLHILDGNRGRLLLKSQITGAENFVASPLLADITAAGLLDLATASTNGQIAVYRVNRLIGKGEALWPLFLGNAAHALQ